MQKKRKETRTLRDIDTRVGLINADCLTVHTQTMQLAPRRPTRGNAHAEGKGSRNAELERGEGLAGVYHETNLARGRIVTLELAC